MRRTHIYLLLGALLVGFFVRVPGIFWGRNFPTKWKLHHIDEWTHLVNTEMMIAPHKPPRWNPPYPKGLAAHVAVPVIVARFAQGDLERDPPDIVHLAVAGRAVSVLYGTATILVTFWLAQLLFRDRRVALLTAWLLALGGLHVTQSHFFVADVPALFWFLLGTYLLLVKLRAPDEQKPHHLAGVGFCFGVAFGLKFIVIGLPALVVAVLMRPRKLTSAIYTTVFFLTGFALVNFLSYSPVDLFRSFAKGTNDPYVYSRLMGIVLYIVELPSIVSFPTLIFLAIGTYSIAKSLAQNSNSREYLTPVGLAVVLPILIHLLLLILKYDHFPRHVIPLVPWIMMLAAKGLMVTINTVARDTAWRGPVTVGLLLPLFVYLALFVFDGERMFQQDPRNETARWLQEHIPAETQVFWRIPEAHSTYEYVNFPESGRPPVLVIPMDDANHYLSGIHWKNSYPTDYREIFDSETQARVDGLQDVFRGATEYSEAIRFKEGYFMPEFLLEDSLLGNRSRNYVAEIVIFTKS